MVKILENYIWMSSFSFIFSFSPAWLLKKNPAQLFSCFSTVAEQLVFIKTLGNCWLHSENCFSPSRYTFSFFIRKKIHKVFTNSHANFKQILKIDWIDTLYINWQLFREISGQWFFKTSSCNPCQSLPLQSSRLSIYTLKNICLWLRSSVCGYEPP